MGLLDWLRGRAPEPPPIEPALPLDTDRTPPPVFDRLERVRQIPSNERGPAERLLPAHDDDLRTAARDRKPESKPEAAQVATQMQNTRTPQPAPSPGGGGPTLDEAIAEVTKVAQQVISDIMTAASRKHGPNSWASEEVSFHVLKAARHSLSSLLPEQFNTSSERHLHLAITRIAFAISIQSRNLNDSTEKSTSSRSI